MISSLQAVAGQILQWPAARVIGSGIAVPMGHRNAVFGGMHQGGGGWASIVMAFLAGGVPFPRGPIYACLQLELQNPGVDGERTTHI